MCQIITKQLWIGESNSSTGRGVFYKIKKKDFNDIQKHGMIRLIARLTRPSKWLLLSVNPCRV